MDFCCWRVDVWHGLLLLEGGCFSWTFLVVPGGCLTGTFVVPGGCLSWTFVVPGGCLTWTFVVVVFLWSFVVIVFVVNAISLFSLLLL